MPESPAGERTEEATPKRRLEARRKGTVARSQELTNAVVIVAALIALPTIISNVSSAFLRSVQHGLGTVPQNVGRGEIGHYLWGVLEGPLLAFLPLLALALVVGLGMNFAQVGFVLSGQALAPNLSRLNPLTGIQRLFSARASVEGLKAILKTALFSYLAYTAVAAHWSELMELSWGTTAAMFSIVGTILHQMFLRVSIAWLVLAALDYYFQKKQVDRQLRMTKQQVRQEMRELEQTPEMRGAIARRRRAISKGRMMEAVKTADVVVTNPTHFAVAVKYESGKMYSPQVVAKGQDLIAMKIREIASESRVPIVPNAPLARALYRKCEIGDFVPRELFQAVAEVLAYVYRTVNRNRRPS